MGHVQPLWADEFRDSYRYLPDASVRPLNGSEPMANGSTVFQLTYTSLFGFHCAYLFLRTGSIVPPTLSHIFCNVMGFPQYALHVRMFPSRRLGESLQLSKNLYLR